jgi:hypothetical protein
VAIQASPSNRFLFANVYDSQLVFPKGELDNPVAAVSFMNSSMTLLNAVISSPTEKKDGSNAMV